MGVLPCSESPASSYSSSSGICQGQFLDGPVAGQRAAESSRARQRTWFGRGLTNPTPRDRRLLDAVRPCLQRPSMRGPDRVHEDVPADFRLTSRSAAQRPAVYYHAHEGRVNVRPTR